MKNFKLLPKRGTTEQINVSEQKSTLGMLLLDTTTKELRIGDGKSIWRELPIIGICPDYLIEACK